MVGEEAAQAFLLRVRHAGAQRILKARHDQDGLDVILLERRAQGVQADPLSRVGRNLQCLEVQALDGIEKPEVGGRLQCDDISRARDGAQAEIDGFRAADRDDQFVVIERCVGEEIAPRDFAGQRLVGPIHGVPADHGRIAPADGPEQPGEFPGGEQRMVRTGGGKRHVIRIQRQFPHPRRQVA